MRANSSKQRFPALRYYRFTVMVKISKNRKKRCFIFFLKRFFVAPAMRIFNFTIYSRAL